MSLAWFPAGDYEEAIGRWPSLAEDCADIPHGGYCCRFESTLLRYSAEGVPLRGVSAIHLADYLPWCADEGLDPELPGTRAHYAGELMRRGQTTPWPPGRNDPCWCRSGQKYKRCCGTVAN